MRKVAPARVPYRDCCTWLRIVSTWSCLLYFISCLHEGSVIQAILDWQNSLVRYSFQSILRSSSYRNKWLFLVYMLRDFNSPFPSCCMPQFQSKSWCTTIQMEMSCVLLCKSNSFSLQKLSTKTHFETETKSNSEMAHSYRNEILAPVQKLGWSRTVMTHSGITFAGGILQKNEEPLEGTGRNSLRNESWPGIMKTLPNLSLDFAMHVLRAVLK